MLWVEQLELRFAVGEAVSFPLAEWNGKLTASPTHGRDRALEERGALLLRRNGAARIASSLRVEWSARLKSTAGRANYRTKLITLNPRLREFGEAEIDRTLRHELAHLLAQFRAGRRRVAAHGQEWRLACRDLDVPGEKRCHTLPLPVTRRAARFVYRCPMCGGEFERVRRIRRALACLACCKKHNRGRFDERAKLRLVRRLESG